MQALSEEPLSPALLDALALRLPQAGVARAVVVGRGWDATAWKLPSPDGDWLLRVPRNADAVQVMEAQHHLGLLLETHGLPVPRDSRLLQDAGGTTVAQLYRYVDGQPAPVAGRGDRARLAASIAQFLSALHPLASQAGTAAGVAPMRAWEDLFGPVVERCAALLPPETGAWVRATGDRLERASHDLPPPVLVHADLKPQHVLVGPGGEIVGVLDFEGVQITDPALDFSRLIQHWDHAFASAVLRQYRGPVDADLMVRAQCYRDLDALQVFDTAVTRGLPEWLVFARRHLASRAAAATRRAARINP